MRRLLAAAFAAAALALASGATAAPAQAQSYTACNGVWVTVDYGSLGGGVSTQCATSYSNGAAALRSAGFSPRIEGGFLLQVRGKPSSPDPQSAYWSYWHAKRQADGNYSAWAYASMGANSTHPEKGDAEGWHYVNTSGTASPPGAKPPKNPVATADPAPAPTKASAKPSSSTTPSASSAKPKNPAPTPTTAGSATPSPSVAATSSPASFPPGVPSADPLGPDAPAGSPTAVIVTASALAVGAASAGGWWLWRGRRR